MRIIIIHSNHESRLAPIDSRLEWSVVGCYQFLGQKIYDRHVLDEPFRIWMPCQIKGRNRSEQTKKKKQSEKTYFTNKCQTHPARIVLFIVQFQIESDFFFLRTLVVLIADCAFSRRELRLETFIGESNRSKCRHETMNEKRRMQARDHIYKPIQI